jgi:hypothetical protein
MRNVVSAWLRSKGAGAMNAADCCLTDPHKAQQFRRSIASNLEFSPRQAARWLFTIQ